MNWQHLRTILWLRSRLSRNQWRRQGKFAAVLRAVFTVAGVLAAIGGGVGGFLLGAVALGDQPAWLGWLALGGMAAVFLFIWLIGVVSEIQRSEAIDIQRMLHLPVSLRQVFVVNYLASLLTPTFILVLPAMLGLAAGLTLSQGPAMLWLLPVTLAFLLAVTAWTYCLRGWLVSLMVNKRRRRTIIMCLTIGVILGSQLPNLLMNNGFVRDQLRQRGRIEQQERQLRFKQRERARQTGKPQVEVAASPKPPAFVVPWWAPLVVSMGGGLLGMLGLHRAYVMTLRFYAGSNPPANRQPAKPVSLRGRPSRFLERSLPGCSEELSAMTLTFLRCALRAPETKMALIMPVVMVLVFGSMHLGRRGGEPPEAFRPLILLGVVGLALLSIIGFVGNAFGSDRQGFRALVLLPVARWRILLAKNLALLPLPSIMALGLFALLTLVWHLPIAILVGGWLQFLSGYLLLTIAGNYTSVRSPYRVAHGSLKPTKTPAKTTLLMMVLHLLFPLAMLPLLLPLGAAALVAFLGGIPFWLTNLLGSAALLAATGLAYGYSLKWAGGYLQTREREVLRVLTAEVE